MRARVLVVSGSPVPSSRSEQLSEVVARDLALRGLDTVRVAVRDLPCVALTTGDHRHPAIRETAAELAAAQALVVVSPVYKSSVPGLLKCWFDVMPRFGLLERCVLPVATARFAEDLPRFAASLDLVLASMGARTVLPVVGLAEPGGPMPPDQRSVLLGAALDRFSVLVEESTTPRPALDLVAAAGAEA